MDKFLYLLKQNFRLYEIHFSENNSSVRNYLTRLLSFETHNRFMTFPVYSKSMKNLCFKHIIEDILKYNSIINLFILILRYSFHIGSD